MIKSALILVPHQDDELNIAGSLLDQLISANIEITVCFMTNGDYDHMEAVRFIEAQKVAKVFGGWKIITLGYGDGGYEGKMLNTSEDTDIIISPAGHNETYGVNGFQDFHFIKYGKHAEYTRNNLYMDIKDLLLYVQADLIFCVDEDSHPDHILLSRLFDRAMEEVVNETNYNPLVLKKFAYLGTWYGSNDYFVRPAKPTNCISISNYENRNDSKPHQWQDRIRFAVTPTIFDLCFWKSKLFKAYSKYKTQKGVLFFPRVANTDAVYWFYDTRNGTYGKSILFPYKEVPFIKYDSIYDETIIKERIKRIHKIIYNGYTFLFYRVPNKIRRITRYGI